MSVETIASLLALILGILFAILVLAQVIYWRRRRSSSLQAIIQIDSLLPQTQCGYCGYAGCRPYAEAILSGDAINKCPPGGQHTIDRLARLVDEPSQALDPAHGETREFAVARIREEECIGCTKCIQACPVDAILGAAKLMHTVITSECTGCDLCLDPCPVDCIDMEPIHTTSILPQRIAGIG